VEFAAKELAIQALKDKKSQKKGYSLSPNQVEDIGMICGGDVTVFLQFISASDHEARSLVDRILAYFDDDEDSWLILDITDETAWKMGVCGTKSGVSGLEMDPKQVEPLLAGRALQMSVGDRRYYSEPLLRSGSVVICGGGHIGQELVAVLHRVGFRCVLLDDREEFVDKGLFPLAEQVKLVDFDKLLETVPISERDYVVIVTRGHSSDYIVLEQVLRTDARYVGMIGSRRKIATTNARLLQAGIAQEDVGRVHQPIGIDIKAETPAEIAISIAAELIMARAQGMGR